MTKYQKDFYKQLHHIIRLYDLLEQDLQLIEYVGAKKDLMLNIKRGRYPSTAQEAFAMRDDYVAKLESIYKQRKLEYTPQEIDNNTIDSIVFKHLSTIYKESQ